MTSPSLNLTKPKLHIAGIDGLRAIAVLAVILFHIDPAWLPGGFAGVDMFFVISGYVVTSSIIGAKYQGVSRSFFLWFYRRRIVRILPAAAVFLFAALLFSVLFIPAAPLTKWIEPTGIAAYLGFSNFLLMWKAGDYFSSSSSFHPFTHTWSLSVEEQFYLIFPAIMYFAGKVSGLGVAGARRRAVYVFHLMSFGSLVLSIYLTKAHNSFAFYSLPTRFWELSVGVYTFLLLSGSRRLMLRGFFESRAGYVSSLMAGIALIWLLAVSEEAAFPFPGAIPICLVTSFVVAVVVLAPRSAVANILGWRPFVYVGLISYSLYLWHWGVVVGMRWTSGLVTSGEKVTALGLTFGLAICSYYLIERPVRYNERLREISDRRFFLSFTVVLSALICVSASLTLMKPRIGLAAANDAEVWSPYLIPTIDNPSCTVLQEKEKLGGGDLIRLRTAGDCGEGAGTLYVIGDSHAAAYTRMLAQYVAAKRSKVVVLSMGGCRLVRASKSPQDQGCSDFLDSALDYLRVAVKPSDSIMVTGFYGGRYWDVWANSHPVGVPASPAVVYGGDDGAGLSEKSSSALEMLGGFERKGVAVIFEEPKPVAKSALFRCADWFNRDNPHCDHRPETVDEFHRRTAGDRALILAASKYLNSPYFWNPGSTLCGVETCPAVKGDKPIFFDADHLSGFGNELLFPAFAAFMQRLKG